MNSKYTSSGATRIGRSKREIKVNDESLPGPGHYRVPSDFGYIDTEEKLISGTLLISSEKTIRQSKSVLPALSDLYFLYRSLYFS